MQEQRTEAYRVYMSDALVLIDTALARGEVDIPRYADMFQEKPQENEETADQIISRFDKLRRQPNG